MSLTVPDYWKYAAKGNKTETWLIQFGYGTGSSFIGVSDKDRVVSSNQYYGLLQDVSDIAEKIDLVNSKGSVSNIQITCSNKLKEGYFTDKIFTATSTTELLNREVKIYSRMGDTLTLSECAQIYSGYLKKVESNDLVVTFYVEIHRSWKDITVPNVKSPNGNWAPVAYGDFTANSEDAFQTNINFYPCPFEYESEGYLNFVVSDTSAVNNCISHYYDKNLDQFIRIKNLNSTSDEIGNVAVAGFTNKMERGFSWYADSVNSGDSGDWDNPGNAVQAAGTATFTDTLDGSSDTGTGDLDLNLPRPSDGALSGSVFVSGYMQFSNGTGYAAGGDATIDMDHYDGGTTDNIDTVLYSGIGDTSQNFDSNSFDVIDTYDKDFTTIILRANFSHNVDADPGETVDCEIGVTRCWVEGTVELDALEDNEARNILDGITEIYMSGGSLQQDYTDGTPSAFASEIHQAHRDLMNRFAGFDYGDSSMDNWSTLDTARSGYDVAFWVKEPTSLAEVLEQLQYEGGFVFMPTFSGGRYVFVEDSYSAGDVVATITDKDIADKPNIGVADISEMITSTTYNYDKNAANGRYQSTYTYTNSVARTAYFKSVLSEENTKTVNLDALIANIGGAGTYPNDIISLYYDNINGTPKVVVECDLTNRAYFNLQYGDIVKFSFDQSPFAKSWGSLYFMITETYKRPNEMRIVAREVG